MYLRDLTVHADNAIVERYKGGFVQRFHREACSVVEHYLAELHRKVVTDSEAKIGLTFTDEITTPPTYSPSLCFYPWPFDFATYLQSETHARKQRQVLDSFHGALIWIAKHKGWDETAFQTAYQTIVDRKFCFTGMSKQSWLCPLQRFRTRVFFDWQLNGIALFAVLFRNRSTVEMARQHLGTGLPMAGILQEYLNAGKWQSNTIFAVDVAIPFRKQWTVDFFDHIASGAT